MLGNAFPILALVSAHPQLAARRAKVKTYRITAIAAHRLSFDRPPRLFFWHASISTLPGFAAVMRNVDSRPSVGACARPYLGAIHREHPCCLVVAWVHRHRKADIADFFRHVSTDTNPGLRWPVNAINTAVILLVDAIWIAGAHAE